jgi:hypothetical protein
MRIQALLAAVPVAAIVVSLAGCTTRSATFGGYGDDQVWSAMVAAARTPEYDDWKVRDNEVFVDDASRRLEVYRVLKRLYVTPFADPRKEEEEWRLQIVLGRDEALDAPTVDFTARQISVPAHVWREADRYFAQVRSLLGAPTSTGEAEAPSSRANDSVPVPPPLPAAAASEVRADQPAAARETSSGTPAEPLPER